MMLRLQEAAASSASPEPSTDDYGSDTSMASVVAVGSSGGDGDVVSTS